MEAGGGHPRKPSTSQQPVWNRLRTHHRRRRQLPFLLKAALACGVAVLIITTAALFCSLQQGAGREQLHSQWQQPTPMLVVAPWMEHTRIVGQITPRAAQTPNQTVESALRSGRPVSNVHELQETDDEARISHMLEALSGDDHQILNSVRRPFDKFCMYSERNSGSNWVSKLLEVNFELKYVTDECPHKHDLGLSIPNEFMLLPSNVLVVAVFRNAFDWAASMHRHPWHAANHCNGSFPEFLEREWSPGKLAGRPNWLHGEPFCPKYHTNHSRMPMIYESLAGVHAENILELRAWKAARALEVCQVRQQSVCVRHEDLIENATVWLLDLQEQFGLKTKPGFPIEVVNYKGVKTREKYIPYSEFNTMRFGSGKSDYYHDHTMKLMRKHLDMPLESALGYLYTDIFKRWLSDEPEFAPFQFPDASHFGVEEAAAAATTDSAEEDIGTSIRRVDNLRSSRKVMD